MLATYEWFLGQQKMELRKDHVIVISETQIFRQSSSFFFVISGESRMFVFSKGDCSYWKQSRENRTKAFNKDDLEYTGRLPKAAHDRCSKICQGKVALRFVMAGYNSPKNAGRAAKNVSEYQEKKLSITLGQKKLFTTLGRCLVNSPFLI